MEDIEKEESLEQLTIDGKYVFLVRHGQSESNAGMRTKDPVSICLTSLGHRQAKLTAASLPRNPDLIVASPYARAQETAAHLVQSDFRGQVAVWDVQEFTYLCAKKYSNTTYHERKKGRNEYWDRLNPDYIDGEGAESFRHFIRRVDDFLVRVQTSPAKFFVVCSHGQFARGVFLRLNAGLPVDAEMMIRFRRLNRGIPMPNCSITTLLVLPNEIFWSGPSVEHLPKNLQSD